MHYRAVHSELLITNSCAPNGAQAFLLPANGETERGVKTIDRARNKARFALV